MKVMTVVLAGLGALALVGGMAASLAPTTDANRGRVALMASQQMSQNLNEKPKPDTGSIDPARPGRASKRHA